MLEAVRRFAPQTAIIYASSNKVYGNLDHLDLIESATRYQPRTLQAGVDESTAIEFHTPYGCSKGAADQYMLDYARSFGLNTVVFRHSTIYGGRQFATYDQGWVGWFCRQALESKHDPARAAFTISGDGKQVRDLLHVSDAVAAYVAAYEHIAAARGQAFNIGGGMENSMSLLELLLFLEKRLGDQAELHAPALARQRPEVLRRRQQQSRAPPPLVAADGEGAGHRRHPGVGVALTLRFRHAPDSSARKPRSSESQSSIASASVLMRNCGYCAASLDVDSPESRGLAAGCFNSAVVTPSSSDASSPNARATCCANSSLPSNSGPAT